MRHYQKPKNLSILRPKKNFNETIENIFLHMVGTYLKLPFQKAFLEIFGIHIVAFGISRAGYSENNKSQVF